MGGLQAWGLPGALKAGPQSFFGKLLDFVGNYAQKVTFEWLSCSIYCIKIFENVGGV